VVRIVEVPSIDSGKELISSLSNQRDHAKIMSRQIRVKVVSAANRSAYSSASSTTVIEQYSTVYI